MNNPLLVNVWGKRFKLPQLTHDSFLTLHHSCKIFFWYLPNWTSTNLWCVVLYTTYSTTHQRSVEVQFGRYQKNILQEWFMVKKLSCVSCGSLKRFPHTFTSVIHKLDWQDFWTFWPPSPTCAFLYCGNLHTIDITTFCQRCLWTFPLITSIHISDIDGPFDLLTLNSNVICGLA